MTEGESVEESNYSRGFTSEIQRDQRELWPWEWLVLVNQGSTAYQFDWGQACLRQSGIRARECCRSWRVGGKFCQVYHSESDPKDMVKDEVEKMQLKKSCESSEKE